MLEADFWQDKNRSQNIIKEKKLFEDLINSYKNSVEQLSDLDDLHHLAVEEKNEAVQSEIIQNIKDLGKSAKKMKLSAFYLMKQTL